MRSFALSLVACIVLTSAAHAETPPAAENVVRACELVSITATKGQDTPTSGTCYSAADDFLRGLAGASDANELVLGLVDQLASLVVTDDKCGVLEDEVSRAILLAQAYVTSDDARAQLISYGQTVSECAAPHAAPAASPS